MHFKTKILLSGLITIFSCSFARADFIPIAQPTAAYLQSTTLADFTDPDFTLVGSLSSGAQTLSYDNLLEERSVTGTAAGSWGSWGAPPTIETATPRVGFAANSSELTVSLSVPVTTFGLEVEPDKSAAEETTADFFSGATLVGTLDLFPNGSSGALLFAASTTTNPFTNVVITNLTGDDFAIARQRFTLDAAPVPEPASYALVSLLVAAGLFVSRSRR